MADLRQHAARRVTAPRLTARRLAVRTLIGLLVLLGSAAVAQQRPLILVFAVNYAPGGGRPIQEAPAEPAAVEPPVLAMRAVRDRLVAARVVEAVAFEPDRAAKNPIFARAFAEIRGPINRQNPTSDDRLAIGKAVGAQYVVAVAAERDAEGGIIIEVQALETASGKTWAAQEKARAGQASVRTSPATTAPYGNDVLSAANTLVVKFLAGPLGDTARTTPSPELPTTAPTVDAAPRDPNAEARAALARGEELLAAGDANGAVEAFRRAINLAPRQAAPRASLTRAYLAAGRGQDAVSEVKRALALVSANDTAGQIELTRLLAQAHARAGDTLAAVVTYEEILRARPQAGWARIALGDLLRTLNRTDEAETHYRAARKVESAGAEAAERLARLRADRNDWTGALEEIAGVGAAQRPRLVSDLFDHGAAALSASLMRARRAFDEGQIGREAFHKAASAQAARATALLAFLKSAAPGEEGPLQRAYRRRIFAGSLLAQAAASMIVFIETGQAEAGGRALVLLGEARTEIAEAQSQEKAAESAGRSAVGTRPEESTR